MARNKPRLQLALYARPKFPKSYHYALFIAPKTAKSSTTKHHAKNTLLVDGSGGMSQPWRYEHTAVPDVATELYLLARIVIAKVVMPCDQVYEILESVPVYQVDDADEAKARAFDCRTWVEDAFRELRERGAVSARWEEWGEVERRALEYVERKKEQGRWDKRCEGGKGVPMMDLFTEKECVE